MCVCVMMMVMMIDSCEYLIVVSLNFNNISNIITRSNYNAFEHLILYHKHFISKRQFCEFHNNLEM